MPAHRTILRIEDAEGRGPYSSATGAVGLRSIHERYGVDTDHNRACPREDHRLYEQWQHLNCLHTSCYLFGFSSPRQARDWIAVRAAARDLDQLGYRLATYRLPKSQVLDGDKQIAFHSRCAARLARYPVSSLLSSQP